MGGERQVGILDLLREGLHTSHKGSLQTNHQANKAILEADQARRSSYRLADHTGDRETWRKHTHTHAPWRWNQQIQTIENSAGQVTGFFHQVERGTYR